MEQDRVIYRPWQAAWRTAGIDKAERGERLLVGNIAPGSGKTLATNDLTNELYRRGIIDCVVIFVPRVNLCVQYELDWSGQRSLYGGKVMGSVEFRKNEPPLFREGKDGKKNFGYVSAYQSLVSRVDIHLKELRGRRYMLVVDEAQILGYDSYEEKGTMAAVAVERLAKDAAFIQLVSGTPYRGDGQRLILASYSGPDNSGLYRLNSDVDATYLEGVREGYLRPFEATLCDGSALREYMDGDKEHLIISGMDRGVSAVLKDKRFWQPIVDMTIEKVIEVQNIDPRFCGLIGACDQPHAREIAAYLAQHPAGIKSLIAVSSEELAQDNLRSFKSGDYDILITVAMAHVGYDHKPITVVTCLNGYREIGWLMQFVARGLRMMPDVPSDLQMLYFICPNDKLMAIFADTMRRQSGQGIKERQERKKSEEQDQPAQPRLSTITDVTFGDLTSKGMDPDSDLAASEFKVVDGYRRRYAIGAASCTGLGRLLRDNGLLTIERPEPAPAPPSQSATSNVTGREWEKKLRDEICRLEKQADGKLISANVLFDQKDRAWQFGDTGRIRMQKFGSSITTMGIPELERVKMWVAGEWLPEVERMRNRYANNNR